jgi:hypothetical protein
LPYQCAPTNGRSWFADKRRSVGVWIGERSAAFGFDRIERTNDARERARAACCSLGRCERPPTPRRVNVTQRDVTAIATTSSARGSLHAHRAIERRLRLEVV